MTIDYCLFVTIEPHFLGYPIDSTSPLLPYTTFCLALKHKGAAMSSHNETDKPQGNENEEFVDENNNENEYTDADNKEIIAYALGGISESISSFDMHLKNNLLMYVLMLHPMMIVVIGILSTLWDAITDPIMAVITDNSKNRWGRRRPFILIGGLGTTVISVLIWYHFPKGENIVKNTPDIPEVVQSQDALVNFGNMVKGYGYGSTAFRLTLENDQKNDSEKPADNISAVIEKSLKKINARMQLAEDSTSTNVLSLTINTAGFEHTYLETEPIGQTLSVNMSLADTIHINNTVRIEKEYPEERGLLTVGEDWIKGRNSYIGLAFDGEDIDFKHNTFAPSIVYRARVALIEKSLIEAIGTYYKLPYWKCFPKNTEDEKVLRQEIQLSETLTNSEQYGLNENDVSIYEPQLNYLVESIEKRRKYNVLKNALRDKTINPETDKLLRLASLEPDTLEYYKHVFKKGSIAKASADQFNKDLLSISEEEIEQARQQLATELNTSPYRNYISLQTKFMLYGLGHKMDMLHYGFSPKEQNITNALIEKEKLVNEQGLYSYLWDKMDEPLPLSNEEVNADIWGTPRLLKSEVITSRFLSPKIAGEQPGFFKKIADGFDLFGKNKEKDTIFIYMIGALMIFSIFRTINGVPYYALGIEIAPSYNGRTKVVAIRSIMGKIIGLSIPWLFPLVLLPCFSDAIDGALWLGIVCGVISVPLLIYSVKNTRERVILDKKKKSVPFSKSIADTVKVPEFWRVLALFFILQQALGISSMVGGYLILYWVFDGALLYGASYLAIVHSLGYFVALLSVPLIAWMCNKYQKHNALRFAIFMMMINALLSWVCYNPDYPELMFILPFFGSIGISSMYTVMGTLMADVTDVDELRSGSRREGMFGAVNGMVLKMATPIGAIITGLVVVISGFDVDLGAHQEDGVFTNIRLLITFLPLLPLLLGLLLLYKYPLNKKRMEEIKATLAKRHAEAKKAND